MSFEASNLLLVLHDSLTSQVAEFRLRLLGFCPEVVPSSEEALGRLSLGVPDLVIVDPEQPGMSGLELISRIRREERTKNVPVLVCTSESNLTAVNKAFRAGANSYLLTPFDPAILESKVEALLDESAQAVV